MRNDRASNEFTSRTELWPCSQAWRNQSPFSFRLLFQRSSSSTLSYILGCMVNCSSGLINLNKYIMHGKKTGGLAPLYIHGHDQSLIVMSF